MGIGRRIEGEGRFVIGGRQVPDEVGGVLRPGIVGKGADDEFSWKRILTQLDPDLPVEAFLAESILFAGDALDRARTDVDGGCDPLDGGLVGPPLKEIDQGNFDAVIVIDLVDQLGGRGWRRDSCIVVDELSVDGKVFPVVEKEGVFIVAFQLRAKQVWPHGQESVCLAVCDDLSVFKNVVIRNLGVDLKRLEAAKISTHLVESRHRIGIDLRVSLRAGLMASLCQNVWAERHTKDNRCDDQRCNEQRDAVRISPLCRRC